MANTINDVTDRGLASPNTAKGDLVMKKRQVQSTDAVKVMRARDAAANAHAVGKTRGKKVAKAPKPPAEATATKPLGLLDAAVKVMVADNIPMRTGRIVELVTEKGLWTSSGKTPAATLYSAILREINTKGAASRFKKTDRGLFMLNWKEA